MSFDVLFKLQARFVSFTHSHNSAGVCYTATRSSSAQNAGTQNPSINCVWFVVCSEES